MKRLCRETHPLFFAFARFYVYINSLLNHMHKSDRNENETPYGYESEILTAVHLLPHRNAGKYR